MTAEKLTRTCEECKWDNGVHYVDDGDPTKQPRSFPCPNKVMVAQLVQARELTAKQVTAATAAAREIVKDAAEKLFVFSANDVHDRVEVSQIVSQGTMGNAFTWAESQGLIEKTGRMVPSRLGSTNGHVIHEWRSLIRQGSAA